METRSPSLLRLSIMVAFALSCLGLLLFLWLSFGGSIPFERKGYRLNIEFSDATRLATQGDVRIAGVLVGKVKAITPGNTTGRAHVIFELADKYAPLPVDTQAILREKTLLGETYIELTPGSKTGPKLADGATISQSRVSSTVQLDEVLRVFDPQVREQFKYWLQAQAVALQGRGPDLSGALANLAPLATNLDRLATILNSQQAAVQQLFSNASTVFAALAERDGQLTQLVRSASDVFTQTGNSDRQLKEAFIALPTFEKELRLTVKRLAEFAENTNPLITQLKPAAKASHPVFTDAKELAPDLRALFENIGPLTDASRKGFPALEKTLNQLRPLLGNTEPAVQQLLPMVEFLGQYKPELTAFFANIVAATQARGLVGPKLVHYLRTTSPLNLESLAPYPTRVGDNRSNPYPKPGASNLLASGLPVFENRNCGRPLPTLSSATPSDKTPATAQALLANVALYAYPQPAPGQPSAPPCLLQGPFSFEGNVTQYPHVTAVSP